MKSFFLLLMPGLLSTMACSPLPDALTPDSGTHETGIVKGRMVDSQGKGVANAEIIASSTDWHNKTTNAAGNYPIFR